jgi:hypothetical protein
VNQSLPAGFPALPPHLVPAIGLVRAQACSTLLAGMANYARRAARLSHAQAAAALEALCAQLPAGEAEPSAPAAAAGPLGLSRLADEDAHDRYFHICRVSASEGTTFLRSILAAARMFHAEMDAVYAALDAARFAAVGGGFAALIGQIAEIRTAPIEHHAAAPPAKPIEFMPMRRWLLGHHVFAALTQGIIFALQELETAMHDAVDSCAREAFTLAADLMVASAVAFRFTADFKASDYRDVVRPTMMGQDVGKGFSGLLSLDHRRLVVILGRIRPLMGQAERRFADEHQRLHLALNHVYDDHTFVCAQFGGAEKPSLRCPHRSPLPGVEQLALYQQARVELLRASSGADTPTVG